MNKMLIEAFKRKDYAAIIELLQPLYKKQLQNIPYDMREDFLQECYITTIRIVEQFQLHSDGKKENTSFNKM